MAVSPLWGFLDFFTFFSREKINFCHHIRERLVQYIKTRIPAFSDPEVAIDFPNR